MNQSRQYWSSVWLSMRSLAVPQLPAVGTMTSSPGRQSAGGGHVLGVSLLQSLDDALYLVEVAARAQRVVEDEAYLRLGVYDEHRADRLRVALARLDHAVLVCDLHADVLDERELHLYVLLAVPAQLLDLAQPGDVRIQRVHGQAHELGVHGLELVCHGREGHEFGGADRCEVRRVAEQDDPFALVVLREADVPLCGHGLEAGGCISNKRHAAVYIVLHRVDLL